MKAKILILVKNLEHVRNLLELIDNCYTIEGKDSIEDRYRIISQFIEEESGSTLVGTTVLQTGVSIDEITQNKEVLIEQRSRNTVQLVLR